MKAIQNILPIRLLTSVILLYQKDVQRCAADAESDMVIVRVIIESTWQIIIIKLIMYLLIKFISACHNWSMMQLHRVQSLYWSVYVFWFDPKSQHPNTCNRVIIRHNTSTNYFKSFELAGRWQFWVTWKCLFIFDFFKLKVSKRF